MTNRIKYLSLLIVVFSLAIFFTLRHNQGKSSTSLKTQNEFILRDTLGVDRITVGNQTLEKTPRGWILNRTVPVDDEILASWLTMTTQMEIKQEIPNEQRDPVERAFDRNGIEVMAYSGEELRSKFVLAGDGDETYAINPANQKVFSVYIPGYFIKIRSLFDLSAETWRDLTLFQLNWRTLKDFSIDYKKSNKQDLHIYFADRFYAVEGVEALDSAKLYYYITEAARFKAEQFLEDNKLRDSLTELTPFCTVSLEDINASEPQKLNVYTVEPNIYGILYPNKQLVRLDPKRLGNFLASPKEFAR